MAPRRVVSPSHLAWLAPLALLACGGTRVQSGEPPEGFAGVFHLAHARTAYNIAIDAGGVVRFSIDGCDTGGTGTLRWEEREGALEVTGSGGEPAVTLTREPGSDALLARGAPLLVLGAALPQRWERGGVCAVCPFGMAEPRTQACAEPRLP
jgi:hypothetical protein